SVDAFDLAGRKATYAMIGAATVGERADDRDLVRQRRIRQRDRDAVVMRTHVERVFVRERNINGDARRCAFGDRGDPRLAAAGSFAHLVAEYGGEHRDPVLLLAVNTDDRSLAITLRLVRREHGNRERADGASDSGAGVGERLQIA